MFGVGEQHWLEAETPCKESISTIHVKVMDSGSILKEKPARFADRFCVHVRGRGATLVEIKKAVLEGLVLQNAFQALQSGSRGTAGYMHLEVREDTSGSGQLVHFAIAMKSARTRTDGDERGPGDTNIKKSSLQRR